MSEKACICRPGDPCDYHMTTCVVCTPRGTCQGHPVTTKALLMAVHECMAYADRAAQAVMYKLYHQHEIIGEYLTEGQMDTLRDLLEQYGNVSTLGEQSRCRRPTEDKKGGDLEFKQDCPMCHEETDNLVHHTCKGTTLPGYEGEYDDDRIGDFEGGKPK